MGTLADSTPAMLIRDYIVAGSRSPLFNGWVFKFGQIPNTPDMVIALVDQGGPASFPHLLVDNPGVQILVRGSKGGNGYQTSYIMARKIRDIVLGVFTSPAEFTELRGVTERGTGPVPLGYDESDRHTWSMNFQLLVEPDTNALTNRVTL